MDLTIVVSLVLAKVGLLLFFLYRRMTSNFGYWEAQGIPTVKPQLFYGSEKEFFSKIPTVVEEERYQKYGRLYGTYSFDKRALNIADPELVRQVLVKDFNVFHNRRDRISSLPLLNNMLMLAKDETWKRIRNVISPSFTSGKMKKMHCHFVEAAQGLINNFTAAADAKEVLDVKKYFVSYSLDVIGLCVYGIRVDSLKNPTNPFTVNSQKFTCDEFTTLDKLIMLVPAFQSLVPYLLKKRGFAYFVDVCNEIIRKRKAEKETVQQLDFIQLMLDAREGKDIEDDEKGSRDVQQNENENRGWNFTNSMSDLEIQSQTILFLTVGHESTSTALAFVAYDLAMNPDIQETLFQEVENSYEAHGAFHYDMVSKMPYLNAVISESMRLHTGNLKVEREAQEDYMVGSTGVRVSKGDLIMILVHAIHHDPEWYPDPYAFKPERFLPENRSTLVPFTYLPFGEGPRNCMAMRFVLIKVKLCIAMVLHKIKFVATEETKKPVQFLNIATPSGLLMPKEMKMGVEIRR